MSFVNNNKSKTLLSVVLGSYNRKKFLQLLIPGIRAELEKIDGATEIIIVDGGSTDGTLKWLSQQKDIITIIQHNRGQWQEKPIVRKSWGYFMNLAFKAAQGKYVCMLSDDCLIAPNAIVNAYHFFEEKLNTGLKAGGVAFYFRDLPDEKRFYVNYTIDKTLMINHGLFLKKALEEVGYIDEDTFSFYHADDDLALKLKKAGYQIYDAPNSYLEHFLYANIKLRAHIYENERADYNALIEKWKDKYTITDPNDIHGRKYKDSSFEHPLIGRFYKLYRHELKKKKRLQLLYRIKKQIIRIFSELFYIIRYIITSFFLLLTNPRRLGQKIKKSWQKYFSSDS